MERVYWSSLVQTEKSALQRIAQGIMVTTDMEPRHLSRIKQLALIEETGTELKVTGLGRRSLDMVGRTAGS